MSSTINHFNIDTQQQLLVLKSANRIAHLLGKTQFVEESIEGLMSEFMELVGADEGSIQLLRPTTNHSRRTLIRSGEKGNGHLDSRLDDLLTGRAVMHKQVLLTNNIAETLDLGASAKRYKDIQSAISVPLIICDEAIGVVNLARIKPADSFADQEQLLVSLLGSEISEFIEQAQLREKLFNECERLRREVTDRFGAHGIIGKSAAMKEVFSLLERVFPTDGRVLIQGESGTGKELIARIIHYAGPRKERPFVAVDCGALPPNLLESELFGYMRGAFTGANRDRKGLFEEAHAGTLFLDEIANLTIELQAKLLRVLQEGEVRPLGSNRSRKVDVRIIAASSNNIKSKLEAGEFRNDLFYRLNVVPVHLPALRERFGDISILALHFFQKYVQKHKKTLHTISPAAIKILEQYHWPGNVRELENILERAVILAGPGDTVLNPEHLPYEISLAHHRDSFEIPLTGDLNTLLAGFEREILLKVLRHNDWNQSAASRALNISERVIRYKIGQLKLQRPEAFGPNSDPS